MFGSARSCPFFRAENCSAVISDPVEHSLHFAVSQINAVAIVMVESPHLFCNTSVVSRPFPSMKLAT